MLLNAGAYLNLVNRSGQTPLIKAAKYGHFKAVRVLIERYAYVDIRGKVIVRIYASCLSTKSIGRLEYAYCTNFKPLLMTVPSVSGSMASTTCVWYDMSRSSVAHLRIRMK